MRLHLGAEIEYWADGDVSLGVAHSEYYNGQYEVNDFHVVGDTIEENITRLQIWANKLLGYSENGGLRMTGCHDAGHGYVFSGVHLHLQVRGDGHRVYQKCISQKREVARRLSAVVEWDLLRYYGLTFRNLVSHHIHGAGRTSQRSFKRQDKFQPVIYHTEFDTFELRCIEPEMLYTSEGAVALKRILERAYRFLCGGDVRVSSRGKDVCSKLNGLVGDIDNVEQALEYSEFSQWVQREGIKKHYEVIVASGMLHINSNQTILKEGAVTKRGCRDLKALQEDEPPLISSSVNRYRRAREQIYSSVRDT